MPVHRLLSISSNGLWRFVSDIGSIQWREHYQWPLLFALGRKNGVHSIVA